LINPIVNLILTTLWDAIIFDLDGTLIDNIKLIFESYKFAFSQIDAEIRSSMKVVNDNALWGSMGKNLHNIANKFKVPELLISKFEADYKRHQFSSKLALFVGIKEILETLFDLQIPLGIVTSKMSSTTKNAMQKLNINKYFRVIVTADDVNRLKPDAEPILLVCEQLGLTPSRKVVYVGDSVHDIESAKNAGVSAIGVTWGVDGTSICLEAVPCASTITELKIQLISDNF